MGSPPFIPHGRIHGFLSDFAAVIHQQLPVEIEKQLPTVKGSIHPLRKDYGLDCSIPGQRSALIEGSQF